MEINHIAIPTNMDSEEMNGGYVFHPPKTAGYNGRKRPIKVGDAWAEWTFVEMDDTDWDFWTLTLLTSNEYAEFTHAQLFDDDRNLTTFTHCLLYRPEFEGFLPGKHTGVKIRMVEIR